MTSLHLPESRSHAHPPTLMPDHVAPGPGHSVPINGHSCPRLWAEVGSLPSLSQVVMLRLLMHKLSLGFCQSIMSRGREVGDRVRAVRWGLGLV